MSETKPEPWSDEWIEALLRGIGDEHLRRTGNVSYGSSAVIYKFARAIAARAFEEAAIAIFEKCMDADHSGQDGLLCANCVGATKAIRARAREVCDGK